MPGEHQPDQADEAGGADPRGPEPAEAPEAAADLWDQLLDLLKRAKALTAGMRLAHIRQEWVFGKLEPFLGAGKPLGQVQVGSSPGPAEPVVAVPGGEGPGAPEPKAAPKKRGRPPSSKNKPKPAPATVRGGEQVPQAPVAPEPEQQPQQQPRHPVRMTPSQERRMRLIWRQNRFERPWLPAWMSKRNHDAPERRNEAQMLWSFWKYPSYRVQPLLYKRYNELVDVEAEERRLRKEGQEYTDSVGRLTDTVNRRLPQLRYAQAERAGVRRAARDVAAGRNTQESGVVGGIM